MGHPRPGTPETTEDVSAVLIPVDHRETIEAMAVVPTTMTEIPNHGITSPDTEMSGEGDHEILSVEIHSMTKKAMVEEDTGEIVPTSMMIGLAWETKVIDGMNGIKKCTTEEAAIAVGRDEATITIKTQGDSIEIQGRQRAETINLLRTIPKIDAIRLATEVIPRVTVEMSQTMNLHNTKSNRDHPVAVMTSKHPI